MNEDLASPERLAKWSEAFREYSRDTDPTSSLGNLVRVWHELSGEAGMIAVSVKNLKPGQYRINRILHRGLVPTEEAPDTPLHAPETPIHTGGIIAEIIASEKAQVLRDLDLTGDPVLGDRLAGYSQILAFPIFEEGEITSWLLNLHAAGVTVTGAEIERRFIHAALVGTVTNEKRLLQELRRARTWIENEVDEIAQIQKNLLPAAMPATKRIGWAPFYETYERAGGDYYDVFRLDGGDQGGGRWGILIADATGHGPSAAVVVAMLSALRKSFPGTPKGPAELLEYLNRHLMKGEIGYTLVTAHAAFIDADALTLTYASAGHPPPLLRHPDASVTTLDPQCDFPLGVEPSTSYQDTNIQLSAGQTLLFYTDGITEARSPSGDLLGEEGLAEALANTQGSADERLAQLIHSLREHESNNRPTDDQTMLVVHVRE